MRNRRGFTLAEMMIVMAITVVLCAAAIPYTGTQVRMARNQSAEIAISSAMSDAFVKALVQARTDHFSEAPISIDFTAVSADAFTSLQDFQSRAKDTDTLNVSYGGKSVTITANRLPASFDSAQFVFDVSASSKTVDIASIKVGTVTFSAV